MPAPASTPQPRRFGALRDKQSRPYLLTAGLSMMADNVEHVITYWMLWELFHSPALVGFQVISHWLPFLLFSVPFGSLADRFDCRKLVLVGQGLFMFVSAAWGFLFLTDSLQMWQACVLLILHGCAGALWSPAEQMLLHDYAPRNELGNIVRLNATFRSLGMLCGPVVGTALLFLLGPTGGIFFNVLFYLPLCLVMLRSPYTGHTRNTKAARKTSWREIPAVFRTVRRDRTLSSMIVLSALGALFLGGNMQAAMPAIGASLGAGEGMGYGVLLFANSVGGVAGGFLLEATNKLRPTIRTATFTTVAVGLTTVAVTLSGFYAVAVAALLVGGVANLATATVQQTMVQLKAPEEQRGRIVGVFNMVSQGLRTGNGLGIAFMGTAIGVVPAVAVGGALLALCAVAVGFWARKRTRNVDSDEVQIH